MHIRQVAGVGAPGVDDQHFHLGSACLGLFQPAKQYGVGVGHVTADDHHAIAGLQVLIAARWRVGPQAALVADHRRGHTQPGIAVDIVGAHQRPGEFVETVVILGQQLPGDIERHTVGAVLGDGVGEHMGRVVQGTVPIGTATGQAFA